MFNTIVITLRPVPSRDFFDVKVCADLWHGNYNRAIKQAIRSISKQYPKGVVDHFEVLSIEKF